MKTTQIFTSTEFAQFARTTRDALLHYEELGLIKPNARSKGNRRQYSYSQLATVNLIHICQSLGMKLTDIQTLIENRSPELIYKLLAEQIKCIDGNIEDWRRARKLLCVVMDTIHSVRDVDESGITVQWKPKQAITLGEQNDYSGDRDNYDALDSFYQHFHKKHPHMDMNYPVWGLFSEERIKQRDWHWPDKFYFNDPGGTDERLAGFYAVGYKRGGYGQTSDLYERMLEYISYHNFVICGPTYEEYPLNELCINDDKNYLMRIMITVDRIK